MAVNEYLIAAAGQLESAANALRREMEDARGEYMTFEREASHNITNMESDMRALTGQAATATEASAVAHFSSRASGLKKQIEDLKKEVDQRRRQTDDQVRSKEGAISSFMSLARALQNQASSFR